MEIGEQLKVARELKGLSLDDIQTITKIQKRYLVAIEQEDFHVLPGRFYARAFIKEYANAVDLDANELLSGFDDDTFSTEEEETVRYSRMERSRRASSSKGASIFSFLPSIIVVLIIAVIVIVAVLLYQKTLSSPGSDPVDGSDKDEIVRNSDEGNQLPDNDEEDNPPDEEDLEKEKEPVDTPDTGTFNVTEVGTGNSPESTIEYSTSDSDSTITITLKADADSYVQIRNEAGTAYFNGMFTSDMDDEQFDVSSEEKLYFNIGNAQGLSILVDGNELEYPIDANQSVHQKIWLITN